MNDPMARCETEGCGHFKYSQHYGARDVKVLAHAAIAGQCAVRGCECPAYRDAC